MYIEEMLLSKSKYTRPGYKLEKVEAIVIHFTGRADKDYIHWHNFYEERARVGGSYGSAHLFVEKNGGIYSFIPLNEVAWHCGAHTYTRYAQKRFDINNNNIIERLEQPNRKTLSIELRPENNFSCEFSDIVFKAGANLVSFLCQRHNLNPFKDIITHHMITGKKCPYYFVKHPEDFQGFKELVYKNMEN